MRNARCALTIAGSDSGGGAGIQADLKTFASLGVHGLSAITSITAQNTIAVNAILDVSSNMVMAQIDAVVEDIGVDAAKTGMLHTGDIVKVVATEIEKHGFPTVVDPVMVAKSGARLLHQNAIKTMIIALLPLATIITPNAREAEAISGITIRTLDDAKAAAKEIYNMGPKAVVVKGGHIPGPEVTDILYYKDRVKFFKAKRLETKTTHGTGCSFSSAITAELAKGTPVVEAVSIAKEFIHKAIQFGLEIGHGYGPVNPLVDLYNEGKKYYVIQHVNSAIALLEANHEVSALIPECQTNIVMALPYARNHLDVIGIPGRIVKVSNRVKASSCPEFGASKHVANTVLVAMKYDTSIRSGMNIRYSKRIVEICEKMGLLVSSYDRKKEPLKSKRVEGMTTSWGAAQAIEKMGKVPQAIYHTGDWGKEPMITLLNKTPVKVAQLAIKISKEFQNSS